MRVLACGALLFALLACGSKSHTGEGASGAAELGASQHDQAPTTRASMNDAPADAGAPPPTASPEASASDAGSISEPVVDAAAPQHDDHWCCLEQEIKWEYSTFGWLHPQWHLTREGILVPKPYAPTVPSKALTNDVSDCSQGRVCLRDLHEALQHPDVVALFPEGMEFANGIVVDGSAVFIDIGKTRISFGLPYFPDLPEGLKPLFEVLMQLELQNLKDVVPSCASARVSPPSNSSSIEERIWVMSAYLGAPLEFDSCEAAMACECAARPLVDADFDDSKCSGAYLAIAEACM